jgi:hypothetical protein
MHVDEVDPPAPERVLDGAPMMRMSRAACRFGDRSGNSGRGDQAAGHLRALAGDYDRAVSLARERSIQMGENLLGTTHRIRPDGGERKGDVQDAEHHAAQSSSAASASRARMRQRSPSMPQSYAS